jgi:hypothetical protein
MNRVNPTIIMFLELAAWVYRNVDKPSATISAQVKHRTEAAKATGIEARRAPILPKNEKMTNKAAPSCKALRLAILVVSRVCMFSVNVVDPVPVPHTPAMKVEIPSSPIPLLTTPRVGGLKFTSSEAAWYDESCICSDISMHEHLSIIQQLLKSG